MVGNRRQGWAVFARDDRRCSSSRSPSSTRPRPDRRRRSTPPGSSGGNLEGKEVRFGIGSTALFAAVTTVASCGAVNAAMESLTGIGGAVPMAQMMTGEVIFGGVGSGLYWMLLFVILGGLHRGADGRPHAGVPRQEDRGARGQADDGRHARRAAARARHDGVRDRDPSTACRRSTTAGRRASPRRSTPTPRRRTTTARRSPATRASCSRTAGNDGAFGITFADLLGGVAMLAGRFVPILAVLAVAGALAGRRDSPAGPGTMRTDTPTFVVLLSRRPARRAADLRPRAPARPRRAGPDRPALLMRCALSEPRARRRRGVHGVLGLGYPLAGDRRRQVVFPGRADGSGRARRPARRLAPARPGLPQATRGVLPKPAVADRLQRPPRRSSTTAGPNRGARGRDRRQREGLPRARAALHAGLTRARVPAARSDVGLRRRPAHLAGQRRIQAHRVAAVRGICRCTRARSSSTSTPTAAGSASSASPA